MAWSSARRTPPQNPALSRKEWFAGASPTKDNNTPAVSDAPTPTVALLVVFALFSLAQYSQDDHQQIFKTIWDSRPLAPPLAPTPQQYKSPCERPLMTQFLDVYWGKTHLKCYNFFQQCEDHFATAGAKGQN